MPRPSPLYVIYQQQLHFFEIVLTLVSGIYFPSMVLGLLLLGRLSNQIGRRPGLPVAVGVAIASTVALGLARGVVLLFVARALSGFGNGVALAATTAFLSELRPGDDPGGEAAKTSAIDQMLGLGAGPMAAGLLARWRPACWPNMRRGPRSCRSTVAGLVGSIGAALLFSPETQPHHEMPSFRPRFGVPAPQRSAFLGLATGGFCVFAVIGLFTSLVPSMLQQRLQITNHAVVVGVILELFVVGALAGQALRRLGNNRALTVSLALILLGLVLLMVGVMRPALGCFVAGTAVEGAAIGLGFSHGLAAVNQLADDAARARIAASYFMVTSIAAAIPTFGMG